MNDLSNILHRCNNVKRTRDKYLHALHNVYDDKGTGEESASQPLAVNRSSLIRTNKRLREETYTIGVEIIGMELSSKYRQHGERETK